MMNLKRVGYYKEMPHGEETDPSIMDHIHIKQKSQEITRICEYLEKAVPIDVCAGFVEDVINPENGVAGSPGDFTDGVWIWPGDLPYYVRNYMLKLPDEFIETMETNQWSIPIKESDIDWDALEIEGVNLF